MMKVQLPFLTQFRKINNLLALFRCLKIEQTGFVKDRLNELLIVLALLLTLVCLFNVTYEVLYVNNLTKQKVRNSLEWRNVKELSDKEI